MAGGSIGLCRSCIRSADNAAVTCCMSLRGRAMMWVLVPSRTVVR